MTLNSLAAHTIEVFRYKLFLMTIKCVLRTVCKLLMFVSMLRVFFTLSSASKISCLLEWLFLITVTCVISSHIIKDLEREKIKHTKKIKSDRFL